MDFTLIGMAFTSSALALSRQANTCWHTNAVSPVSERRFEIRLQGAVKLRCVHFTLQSLYWMYSQDHTVVVERLFCFDSFQ